MTCSCMESMTIFCLSFLAGVQMSDSARQLLAVCEKNPSDAVQLNYDARNPFDLCSITFTPIYRYAQL